MYILRFFKNSFVLLLIAPLELFVASTFIAFIANCKSEFSGALKFKSQLTTIELKQYDNTHRIDRELNKVFIQSLKKGLKVKGLEQLDELEAIYGDIDIASAQIIDRSEVSFLK